MSAPAATQSVPDVAVTDATDTADRPASRMLAQVVRWARRVPFTIGVVALIVVLGVVGEGWWRRVDRASWFPDIAYGLPPLREAKVWTPITGMPFGLTPAQYVTMTIAFAVLVGWAEWRLGTVRTAAVAVGGQVVGVLGAAAFLAIFDETDWDWADRLADVRDVGLTTAIVAAVAAASATLRSPWRLRARAILTAYVAIAFLFEGTLADVQHLVAFAVASAGRRTLVQPRRARALATHPARGPDARVRRFAAHRRRRDRRVAVSRATVRSGPRHRRHRIQHRLERDRRPRHHRRWWRCSCGAAGAGRGG